MEPEVQIAASERKLTAKLENFFKKEFEGVRLESHGLDHHRRVWKYAKEILRLDLSGVTQGFTDSLMIACHLHDIGMATDPGEKHGKVSAKLCADFLNENKMDTSSFSDLVRAIEIHDNKDYSENSTDGRLHLYLSVADDLDALGYTGIFRYLEIYQLRGLNPAETCEMVLKNAEKRFANIENHFAAYMEFVEKHRRRFLILKDFFTNLRAELSDSA
jgi:HD superfamily phosphodiesterase